MTKRLVLWIQMFQLSPVPPEFYLCGCAPLSQCQLATLCKNPTGCHLSARRLIAEMFLMFPLLWMYLCHQLLHLNNTVKEDRQSFFILTEVSCPLKGNGCLLTSGRFDIPFSQRRSSHQMCINCSGLIQNTLTNKILQFFNDNDLRYNQSFEAQRHPSFDPYYTTLTALELSFQH